LNSTDAEIRLTPITRPDKTIATSKLALTKS